MIRNQTNLRKICFLADTLNARSGWGRLAGEIISRVSQDPLFEVIVLTKEKSGNHPREFVVLQYGFWGMAKSVLRSRRFIKESDIIYSFDGWPNSVIAAFANIFLGKKFFITAVGTYSVLPLDRFFQGILLRFAYRRAEKILAISDYTKEEILKRVKLDNIEVVNLGVDFEKFNRAYATSRLKKNILLSVGEVKERKGYHVALEAFFKLKNKFTDLTYIIAGGYEPNSNYFRYLLDIVRQNNGKDSVIFTGSVSEESLLELYREAKIFLMPSVNAGGAFEGFGLVILEAFSAGIPAVGTTPSGIDDIITNGVNGFLVSQNDSDALVRTLEKILADAELYSRLSNGALARAKEMSWEKTVEKYKSVYGS